MTFELVEEAVAHEVLKQYRKYGLIGESHQIQYLGKLIERVSALPVNVLITGETGTGKGLVAKAIHEGSKIGENRRSGDFIDINCAAIPESLLESELFGYEKGAFTGAIKYKQGMVAAADCGTLFLDEIGDMPINLQAKLLNAIEERKVTPLGRTKPIVVDIRIVAATSKNLEQMIQKRNFREDLYFRLNVFPMYIPPLRERREDIPPLVHHFVDVYSMENKVNKIFFMPDALKALMSYSWPGNIRELQNIVQRALVLYHDKGDLLTTEDVGNIFALNSNGNSGTRYVEGILKERGIDYIELALKEYNGNVIQAAKVLGMSRSGLYKKMREYGIDAKLFRNEHKNEHK